ncbi:biosynthetic arginine decarboxylase [Desulfurispirillum indicum]|uniref:biosynthetic arginine decarboxylase n=1 Tax=Desulfurispirillum indicum TaxID=936456 RepID=UPI001CFC1391|nr:biosynthetic arginine decarboxylase [Desulfurispirillum indicum]UCZ57825.1 biosynthetic arginine decarboxylase [Desulfurispirillum indicum]
MQKADVIAENLRRFRVDNWSEGYFSINEAGEVVVRCQGQSIPLTNVIEAAHNLGLSTPFIIRFPFLIGEQIKKFYRAFQHAKEEFNYKGEHKAVFPIKVNQNRHFIERLLHYGKDFSYGLEAGSKAELFAVLISDIPENALITCNGFKDREFLDLAVIGKQLGKDICVIIESVEELVGLIDIYRRAETIPAIGFRIKLSSRGSGKWEKSSGEGAKFGLSSTEILLAIDLLKEHDLLDRVNLLHFHIGSQITNVRTMKRAIREAGVIFAEVAKLGLNIKYLNIGGGIGVDYSGSKSSSLASAEYSIEEFANDVVFTMEDMCNKHGLERPGIVTESGRVIAAYHAIVVTDLVEIMGAEYDLSHYQQTQNEVKPLLELKYALEYMNEKNYIEYYHDALEFKEDLRTMFTLGLCSLVDKSNGDILFQEIVEKTIAIALRKGENFEKDPFLRKFLAEKYLCNFSVFNAIPDSWAIRQLFPIMPLKHLDRPCDNFGVITDITCDSDGVVNAYQFPDTAENEYLPLHDEMADYPIGIFLTGAYQEVLANKHNLLGQMNEISVDFNEEGKLDVVSSEQGDTVKDVLNGMRYDDAFINNQSKRFFQSMDNPKLFRRFRSYLNSYTYMIKDGHD